MAVGKGPVEGMAVDQAFWRDRRVFLTGHTGFKGGWLSLWLQSMGAEVTGYSLAPPTDPSLFELAGIAKGMNSVLGDIRDQAVLKQALVECRPEVVFHMAAQPLVRRSYVDPVETFHTNVLGTVPVLEAVRELEAVRVVVNVTSDKCYQNLERREGYRETDPMGGKDPYSSSKGCAELVTTAYRHSFFSGREGRETRNIVSGREGRETSNVVSGGDNRKTSNVVSGGDGRETRAVLASARPGNVVGGGDWPVDRPVPDAIRASAAGKPVVLRMPDAVRPWQHVMDPLSGYLLLAERLWDDGPRFAEAWNFGPPEGSELTVAEVVETIAQLWGWGARWEHEPHEAVPGEAMPEAHTLRLDCGKARERLGWSPALALATALEWTVEWYKAAQKGGDVHELTLLQIEKFQSGRRDG